MLEILKNYLRIQLGLPESTIVYIRMIGGITSGVWHRRVQYDSLGSPRVEDPRFPKVFLVFGPTWLYLEEDRGLASCPGEWIHKSGPPIRFPKAH